MFFSPVSYNEPVFRPPGESNSVIVQATIGCSWNKCAFCEMYSSKSFTPRNQQDIFDDIKTLSEYYSGAKKVFLADGNAFVLSAGKLISILKEISTCFGKIQRVSSYASAKDVLSKTVAELQELKALGLKLLYIGAETGDDALLESINKEESYNSTIEGVLKAQEAGIDTSIMIVNGLGGKKYSRQHAIQSAKLINKINPKFLSTLTLSLPLGIGHYQNRFKGTYEQQTVVELLEELKLFVEHINVNGVIYRSDHVSNSLILKGILSRDKDRLLDLINSAIERTPAEVYPEHLSVL